MTIIDYAEFRQCHYFGRLNKMARSTIEKKCFSERLKQSLQNANYSPNSPSQLARQFNSRFAGPPISSEAARKWLAAETFPTEEKLLTIAKWLDVSPDWLRFNIVKQEAGAETVQHS